MSTSGTRGRSTTSQTLRIYAETRPEECRRLWEELVPQEKLTDLWDVRECFHRHFRRELLFVVAEDDGQPAGFLPLAFIPEEGCYGYFPGEVWKGTTWLEQNRLCVRDRDVLEEMLQWLDEQGLSYHLRYLVDPPHEDPDGAKVDEIGYLFLPEQYSNSMDRYYGQFPYKSIKAIKREVRAFEERGLAYRFNEVADLDLMVEMNLERFGESSYFADEKFRKGFDDLAEFLRAKGWLQVITVLIGDKPAAVDMGSVYKNVYTLLAGGTSDGFPGIAKVINLYHMQRACQENFSEADFLCGDFHWKKMFHLTPRPLFLLSNV